MNLRLFTAASAAALALASSAFAQTQPLPSAITSGGQKAASSPVGVMIGPANGAYGPGILWSRANPAPFYCVVFLGSSCGGSSGGGGPVTAVSGAYVAGSIVDLVTLNSKIDTLTAAVQAATPAGANIIGKFSQVDSGGTDATDTTNHALKVNVIAGGGGNLAVNPPDASGTVASGGAFQTVFSTNLARTNCLIQNPVTATEPLYVHFTAAGATLANSFSLGPGSIFSCAGSGTVATGAIQIMAATTAHPFTASGS